MPKAQSKLWGNFREITQGMEDSVLHDNVVKNYLIEGTTYERCWLFGDVSLMIPLLFVSWISLVRY